MAGVHAWVAVTDWDWYRFLQRRGKTEVNFWQPSGGRESGADKIPQGAPFLFKSKYPHGNRIVGGGFLSGWVPLPMTWAWEFFGENNGCATLEEMRNKIRSYRKKALDDGGTNPEIGCIMLRDVQFFDPDEAWKAPSDWPPPTQTWRKYDLASPEGSYLKQVLDALSHLGQVAPDGAAQGDGDPPGAVSGDVYGDSRFTPVRRGQRKFKELVQEAYGQRCAVTGSKIVPVLEAAHIVPVSSRGGNRVDNALLLRSDVHTLFDLGYLGVDPQKKTLLVSTSLRTDWGDGEEFYQRAASGETIGMPERPGDRPNLDFLDWHAKEKFDKAFCASSRHRKMRRASNRGG